MVQASARLAGSTVLATQSDERLVELSQHGNERAFEALVDRYRAPLLRYCGKLLPNSRSEDAVQQAFLNAHGAITSGEIDKELNFRPWLYRIAHNASLNLLRQNGWKYEELSEDFDGVQRPDQAVEERERLRVVVSAIKGLPERQREALVLREFEGRSYESVAAELGVSGGAARQLLRRARGALRAAMSAIIPPQLLMRMSDGAATGSLGRVSEALGGAGGAAVLAKAAISVVAVGAVVVGAEEAHLGGVDQFGTNVAHHAEAVAKSHAGVANLTGVASIEIVRRAAHAHSLGGTEANGNPLAQPIMGSGGSKGAKGSGGTADAAPTTGGVLNVVGPGGPTTGGGSAPEKVSTGIGTGTSGSGSTGSGGSGGSSVSGKTETGKGGDKSTGNSDKGRGQSNSGNSKGQSDSGKTKGSDQSDSGKGGSGKTETGKGGDESKGNSGNGNGNGNSAPQSQGGGGDSPGQSGGGEHGNSGNGNGNSGNGNGNSGNGNGNSGGGHGNRSSGSAGD